MASRAGGAAGAGRAGRRRQRRAALSHVDARGRVKMVDVGDKPVTDARGGRARHRSRCRARRVG